MKRLLRTLVFLVVISVGAQLVGMRLRRSYEAGTTPDDDEFRVAGILGGADVSSTASALRSVAAKVALGGLAIDLSGATLDPAGAAIDIEVALGGVALAVSPSWRVVVESSLSGGDVASDLPDPDTLPEDAPVLTVRVTGRGGGVAISSA
jgi:hypothetical protein